MCMHSYLIVSTHIGKHYYACVLYTCTCILIYVCKVSHYPWDINSIGSVHVYICYLIRCVTRLEALSPMSLYSAIITALPILEQYVINIIMKKYFNL